jgi:DNA polymerase-3 subunit delta
MTDPPPTVYLLHGDDNFAMTEFIQSMRKRLGKESTAEMNFQEFNAANLEWPALEAAAGSIPFLASRRLIVLEEAEHLEKDSKSLERMLALLEKIPASTAFVLLEHTPLLSGGRLPSPSRLRQWAEAHKSMTYLRECTVPHAAGFITWLQKRAESDGGIIEHEAAVLLAEWIQEDPRLASQELHKLLDYVDRQRPINVEDVEQCTPYRGQSSIFALVDAIGQRRGDVALQTLHQVLQEDDATYAFAMILRQFRLILRARELIDAGKVPDETVHRSKFVVNKVSTQARNFSMADLEQIYYELLAIDLRAKNSQMDLDVALDRLVAAIST